MTVRINVLLVDDDPTLRRAVARLLSSRADVTVADTLESAKEHLLGETKFHAVLSDVDLGTGTGFDLAEHVRVSHPPLYPRVILMSGDPDAGPLDARARASGLRLLQKPFPAEKFFETVARSLRPLGDGSDLTE